MQLIVLLGAELDIQVAFNRFEDYREGFGLKFVQELELAYEYLRRHPRMVRSMRPIGGDFSYRISPSVSSIRSKATEYSFRPFWIFGRIPKESVNAWQNKGWCFQRSQNMKSNPYSAQMY
jgi:hypothetical protein